MPVQILWVDTITAVTLALALAFDPPESGVMGRPPRAADEPLLSRFLLWSGRLAPPMQDWHAPREAAWIA